MDVGLTVGAGEKYLDYKIQQLMIQQDSPFCSDGACFLMMMMMMIDAVLKTTTCGYRQEREKLLLATSICSRFQLLKDKTERDASKSQQSGLICQ